MSVVSCGLYFQLYWVCSSIFHPSIMRAIHPTKVGSIFSRRTSTALKMNSFIYVLYIQRHFLSYFCQPFQHPNESLRLFKYLHVAKVNSIQSNWCPVLMANSSQKAAINRKHVSHSDLNATTSNLKSVTTCQESFVRSLFSSTRTSAEDISSAHFSSQKIDHNRKMEIKDVYNLREADDIVFY